ncbi:hypothetical protein MPTK1_1g09480 [Marchantia polymorpha subsp. ruderalis]|uniref:Coiled-coil domain-containing protein 40 n=4 Tax=Marchantia polymorpha TaxID=3197 RepID=A0AAF6ANA2_MARPO|nr:hypothetical protein MARPO_0096s0052 [Marchantia polymorpha]BBM97922.1 hypothetical protein Mp_1g09480 [Marchantia polymorpha subsp. ruderalis]|eukprot:PTQ32706.1 hypothetical protein MARPO_0096s0052 [Marchantia polymorpha]
MEVSWQDDPNVIDYDDDSAPSVGPNKAKLTDIPEDVRDRRNHPALERAQAALKEQLSAKKQDLEDRIYEQGAFLRRATKRREEAGVALYGMQKALATLHMSLHKDAEDLANAAEAHAKAKDELQKTTLVHRDKTGELKKLRDKMEITHQELDNLLNNLKQVEKYSQEIKSEIAINRRKTYAAEESMSAAEKHKKDQDLQIGLMQTRLKHQYEKQALLRAQLQVQERETKLANVALSEAGTEMESITAEKKQVAIQWQSSLLVLSRCDEALQGLIDAIANQKEQEKSVEVEKESYKKAIRKEQEAAEKQQAILRKIDREMKAVQKQMQAAIAKRLAYYEQYRKLVVSLEQIEAAVKKLKVERTHLETVIKVHEREFTRQSEGTHELEHKILENLVEHISLEKKAAHNTMHSIAKLRGLAKKEDMIATEIQFDLARIRVDVLSVHAYNENIKQAMNAVNNEVEEKLSHIGKVQTEIRKRHAEIEMKTKEIDRLNKTYFKLTANMQAGDQTPWEHIISNMKYEILKITRSSSEKQKRWLLMQTALINIVTTTNDLTESYQKKAVERITLSQRKVRVDTQSEAIKKFTKELEKRVATKQGVILRLNDMVAKNSTLEELLKNENANMQAANYAHLKDLGRDLVALEEKIREMTAEKSYANKHLDELEHHAMLWKYKITFELKTQAQIDPNVGRAVITALQKQCDRLRLTHDGLALVREKLISGLENRVANRSVIDTKVKAMIQRKGFDGPASIEANLIKGCADFRRATKETDKASERIDGQLDALDERRNKVKAEAEHLAFKIQTFVKQQEELRMSLRYECNQKTLELLATALQHRRCRRYEELRNNKWSVHIKSTVEDELAETNTKCCLLVKVVQILMPELPNLQYKLDTLALQLSLATGDVTHPS